MVLNAVDVAVRTIHQAEQRKPERIRQRAPGGHDASGVLDDGVESR